MDDEHGQAHELATLIEKAALGHHPPADGGWTVVRPWRAGVEAVLAFTGHAVLALDADRTPGQLSAWGVDGFGGAHDPRVVAALAGDGGWIDSLDALLVARGTGSGRAAALVARPDLATHPRAGFAAAVRDDLRVLGRPDEAISDVVVVARGVGGLTEISFELDAARRGRGEGSALVRDALDAVPAGELVVAAVAPGNVASLRSLLSAGFVPVGSLQLVRR